MISFTLFLLAMFYLWLSKKTFGIYASPLGVYGFVWSMILALFYLPIIEYYPLSKFTLFVIWASLITFSLGAITVAMTSRERSENRPALTISDSGRKFLKWLIIIFSMLGFANLLIFFIRILNEYGPLIFYAGRLVRGEISSGEISGVLGLVRHMSYGLAYTYIAAILSGVYLAKVSRRFLFAYLPIPTVIMFDIAYSGRSNTMYIIALYVISYLLSQRPLDLKIIKRSAGIIVLLLGTFGVFLSAVDKFRFGGDHLIEATYSSTSLHPVLIQFYRYATNKFPALNVVLEREPENYWWGQKSFYGVALTLKKLGLLDELVEDPSGITEVVWMPVPSNVYTYLRPMYDDFGIVGVIILPYLLGLFASWLFLKYREKPDLVKIYLLSHIYLLILFSFAVITYVHLWIFISIVIGGIVTYLLSIGTAQVSRG